jgi:thiamine-phosphate pyrophosphorylase
MVGFDLHVITRRDRRRGRDHLAVARAALEGGARLVQLRDKKMGARALWEVGRSMRELTRSRGAAFVVNDRVDIALGVEADGVHLGPEDMPIEVARHVLGRQAIIGASVASPVEAQAAEAAGASYVSVGSIFATASKSDAGAPIGTQAIADIKRAVSVPVLAIGGISCENVKAVIDAGADGVAVISAVAEAEDMVAATAALLRAIREARLMREQE